MKQNDKKHLTAENGRPIADNQNTQTAGVRGPVTMQDPWLVSVVLPMPRKRDSPNLQHVSAVWPTLKNPTRSATANCFRM